METINLTFVSETPLYRQVAVQIANQILSGRIKSGSSLPSIRDLAVSQNISVITAQKAYEELSRKGLVVPHRRKGFVVADLAFKDLSQIASDEFRTLVSAAIGKGLKQGLSIHNMRQVINNVFRSVGGKHEKRN